MYALTLHQPWAGLVASGIKRIENRSWKPNDRMIGQLIAIHAGQRFDKPADALMQSLLHDGDRPVPQHLSEARGAIVATCRIGAFVHGDIEAAKLIGKDQQRWFFGPHGWVLSEIEQLETPLLCRGYQKLWNIPLPIAYKLTADRLLPDAPSPQTGGNNETR